MDQGGFVTPLDEVPHDLAMRACEHKGADGRLATPHCAGREGTIGVAKDRNRSSQLRAWPDEPRERIGPGTAAGNAKIEPSAA